MKVWSYNLFCHYYRKTISTAVNAIRGNYTITEVVTIGSESDPHGDDKAFWSHIWDMTVTSISTIWMCYPQDIMSKLAFMHSTEFFMICFMEISHLFWQCKLNIAYI